MVGISSQRPRWEASPSRRGCAIPWPSQIKTSGRTESFSNASITGGRLAEAQEARYIGERGLGDHPGPVDHLQRIGAEHDHRGVERRAHLLYETSAPPTVS